MLQDEYYVMRNDTNSCLFSWDEKSGQFGMGKPVAFKEAVKFRLGEPIPDNPEFLDYHEVPEPVVSKRVYDVLAPMDIYGIQLVPAKVRNPKDPFDEPRDYWFMHVWSRIHCLDTDKSELEYSRSGNTIFGIEKLVLNEKTLAMFELRKRMIFELAESTSVILVHQSFKDVLMSCNPRGVRFFKATEWNSDIVFE